MVDVIGSPDAAVALVCAVLAAVCMLVYAWVVRRAAAQPSDAERNDAGEEIMEFIGEAGEHYALVYRAWPVTVRRREGDAWVWDGVVRGVVVRCRMPSGRELHVRARSMLCWGAEVREMRERQAEIYARLAELGAAQLELMRRTEPSERQAPTVENRSD